MKLNKTIFFIGIGCLGVFFMLFYNISLNRKIRINGKKINTPIVEFSRDSSNRSSGLNCTVLVSGVALYAGPIEEDKYKIGDTILVRYLPDENHVVQERIDPNQYYLFYALSSILLIIGVIALIESFKGKKMSEYKSYTNDEISEWIQKKIREILQLPANKRKSNERRK